MSRFNTDKETLMFPVSQGEQCQQVYLYVLDAVPEHQG